MAIRFSPAVPAGKLAASSSRSTTARCGPPLFPRIDGKPAEQLGVKVGGLLGQHFTGESNVADLFDAAWIHEESNVGAPASHDSQGFFRVAQIREILLVVHGLLREA